PPRSNPRQPPASSSSTSPPPPHLPSPRRRHRSRHHISLLLDASSSASAAARLSTPRMAWCQAGARARLRSGAWWGKACDIHPRLMDPGGSLVATRRRQHGAHQRAVWISTAEPRALHILVSTEQKLRRGDIEPLPLLLPRPPHVRRLTRSQGARRHGDQELGALPRVPPGKDEALREAHLPQEQVPHATYQRRVSPVRTSLSAW
ncbi:unnamed protein product, partial [Urochloa humidicola]